MSENKSMSQQEAGKTKFWTRRALGAISQMRSNKEAGLFPKSEGWRNVVEHELVEAEVADILGEKLGLSDEQRRNLRTAALLHDVFKRKEIERASLEGPSSYDEIPKEQAEWLKTIGYSKEVVDLVEIVGHSSYEKFVEDWDSVSISEKIIQYVDFITLNNDLVPLSQRIRYVEEKEEYKEINESGVGIFGKPYYSVMREIGAEIEAEFAPLLGISDPSTIPEFIKSCINDRIAQEDKT